MKKFPAPVGISVIIPTMNRAEVLLDTLGDLKSQSFRDCEVIVVDQSETPSSAVEALLADFGVPCRYCFVTHFRGLPQARNLGWRLATKDIVLYIDDDIRCGGHFLQAHFDAHVASGAAMVAGGITEVKGDVTARSPTGSFNWWTARTTRNFHLDKACWCLHAPGGNFSVRRHVLESLGGFDESLSVGAALYEESEFSLRLRSAGYRCWFAPDAHLLHLAAPMGGCRVGPDIPEYVFGMGHNRALLIYRHLRPWHRPTAVLRMVLYGVSFCRVTGNCEPFVAALRGMRAGRGAAKQIKADTVPL